MSTPRAHHYLPQFYLKGFSRDDHLWIYDRYKKEFREQTPKNLAVAKDYYTVIDTNGNKNTDIEKFFSVIEGKASAVIKKVERRDLITDKERDILAGDHGGRRQLHRAAEDGAGACPRRGSGRDPLPI